MRPIGLFNEGDIVRFLENEEGPIPEFVVMRDEYEGFENRFHGPSIVLLGLSNGYDAEIITAHGPELVLVELASVSSKQWVKWGREFIAKGLGWGGSK